MLIGLFRARSFLSAACVIVGLGIGRIIRVRRLRARDFRTVIRFRVSNRIGGLNRWSDYRGSSDRGGRCSERNTRNNAEKCKRNSEKT